MSSLATKQTLNMLSHLNAVADPDFLKSAL